MDTINFVSPETVRIPQIIAPFYRSLVQRIKAQDKLMPVKKKEEEEIKQRNCGRNEGVPVIGEESVKVNSCHSAPGSLICCLSFILIFVVFVYFKF